MRSLLMFLVPLGSGLALAHRTRRIHTGILTQRRLAAFSSVYVVAYLPRFL